MKTYVDSAGREVPAKYVTKYDKDRDALCRKILARFREERARLEKVVADSLQEIKAFRVKHELAENAGGNFQTSSFDGSVQVSIEQDSRIILDSRVATARTKMIEYARKLMGVVNSKNSDADALLQIIESAFEANKAGILPHNKVLSLLRLNITAPEWVEAKKILIDSIKPVRGRAYLNCGFRPDPNSRHQNIRLDLADCWPKTTSEN